MNDYDAYTEEVHNGFHAMLRTAGDAEARPVLNKGGRPMVYPDELTAQKVCTQHLLRYVNGNLVRDGEVAGKTQREAESAFKPILRQRGGTRVISVSYKKGQGKCRGDRKKEKADVLSFGTMSEPSTSPGSFG